MGLTPLVTNVEALKGQIYITMAGYEVQPATRSLSLCNEDFNEMLIKKFLVAKAVKGCTDCTLKLYAGELRRHLHAINKNVTEITTDDLRMHLALKATRDHNSKTQIHNIYRVMSSFYGWLYQEEYVKHNPVNKLEMKMPKVHREAFSAIEVERIRAAADTNRDRAIIETLLSTGCRVTELVNIKRSDINGDKIVVEGKGEKKRAVYLNARAKIAIEAYLAERKDDNPWLFAGMIPITEIRGAGKFSEHKWWYKKPEYVAEGKHIGIHAIQCITKDIGRKLGISPCNPHRFRHTCATLAHCRGMDITTVSKMLGHESVETTQIYLDIDDKEVSAQHNKYVL